MTDAHRFSIPLGWDDLNEKLAFAEHHQLGVEIAAFATGPGLWDLSLRRRWERAFAAALRSFPQSLTYHGAFIDLSVHSEDPAIASITRDRIKRDLDTASRLGCRTVVFHTGFNPFVPVASYREQFLERHADFWPKMAEAAPEATICLENHWEPHPDILLDLMRAVKHPRIRVCLDVAHANAYSTMSIETWFDRLEPFVAHLHWSDNHGDRDSHLPVGGGSIPWNRMLACIRILAKQPDIVMELRSVEAIEQSLRHVDCLMSAATSLESQRNAAESLRVSR